MRAMAIVVCTLTVAGAVEQSTPGARAAIGIMYGDEFIVPVAGYQDGAWRLLTESDPSGRMTSRLSSGGRGVSPLGWTRLEPAGARTSFTLRGLSTVRQQCGEVQGYRTSLAPAQLPSTTRGRPEPAKVAIAARGATLERAEDVLAQLDPESRTVGSRVVQHVISGEAERVAAGEAGLGRTSPRVREGTPVRMVRFWRFGRTGEATYYYEARKDYREPLVAVYVTGWIHVRGSELTVSDGAIAVSEVAGRQFARSEVLGILQLDGRVVWILFERHAQGEDHVLFDWTRGSVGRILTIPTARC